MLHITASRGPTGATPCPAAETDPKVEASGGTAPRSRAGRQMSKLLRRCFLSISRISLLRPVPGGARRRCHTLTTSASTLPSGESGSDAVFFSVERTTGTSCVFGWQVGVQHSAERRVPCLARPGSQARNQLLQPAELHQGLTVGFSVCEPISRCK